MATSAENGLLTTSELWKKHIYHPENRISTEKWVFFAMFRNADPIDSAAIQCGSRQLTSKGRAGNLIS